MSKKYGLAIANETVSAPNQEWFAAINPYSREEWALVPQATPSQVADAIAAARRAYDSVWSKTTGLARATLLNRLADLLDAQAERMAIMESTDNGKIIRETHGQMHFAARAYRFFAGCADKIFGDTIPLDQRDVFDFTRREPIGIAVLITAWNSPMGLLANKLAPALAAGNCVVIKPSEHASVTTLEFAALVREAGFPAGVVNVVTGDYRTGQALLSSGRIDRVSFTGSPNVGRQIAGEAGRSLIPVTLELGGKSPNIIFEDADLDKATVGALAGIFGATGQTCIAGSRLLVQRSIHDEIVKRLVARARQIRLGNPPGEDDGNGNGGERAAIRSYPQMHWRCTRRGGGARLRRQACGGGWSGKGPVHRADHLYRRGEQDGNRPGGGVRTRAVGHSLRHRG
jgi:aldehyde dehydrogenase (NAD+)